MRKEDQMIMVIPRKDLLGNFDVNDSPQGFLPLDIYDFATEINSHSIWMRRGNADNPKEGGAESNPAYKQPIAYSIVINTKKRSIFAYQRANNDNYHESRLSGNWSWGIGGHVEKLDYKKGSSAVATIERSRDREISEEIYIEGEVYPRLIGYINDDSNSVGRVHFGLLYIIETNSDVNPKDPELASGRWTSVDELEEICRNAKTGDGVRIDSWSEIALNPIKKYLKKS